LGQIGGPTQHGISNENASELVRLSTLQIQPPPPRQPAFLQRAMIAGLIWHGLCRVLPSCQAADSVSQRACSGICRPGDWTLLTTLSPLPWIS